MNKICKIPKNAKLLYGSGGSKCIIAITDDKAFKYFPIILYEDDDKSIIKKLLNDFRLEIHVIKLLTEEFVNKNLSPHIIKYINHTKCDIIPDYLFDNCLDYDKYLLTDKKADGNCKYIYKNYPTYLVKPLYVLEMEKIDYSLSAEIKNISNKKWSIIKEFLDRIIFQIFFTLEIIREKYPDYSHNDLFIRNILCNYNEDEEELYDRYKYKNEIFDIPHNGICIKFNDFGMNYISQKFNKNFIKDRIVIHNPYRDYFSIIYDIYNGSNLGSNSLNNLIKNKSKLQDIDKYFKNFIDVNIIKKIIKNNKKEMLDWDWNKTYDEKIVKLLKIQNFKDKIGYFKKLYPYNKNNKIKNIYG